MALTEAGAMALSAAGSLGSNVAGGLFNVNQARKNRAFQERMFYKQIEETRKNWQMENEYNLPSAQRQRLEDANLNPYLMYGEGAAGLTSQGSIGSPGLPSGSQAHSQFGNPMLDALQARLITAQSQNIEANTQKTISETDWQNIENKFSRESYQIRLAIKYRDYDMLNTTMDKMRNEMYNATQITTQQVLSMMQGREFEIKRYHLDSWYMGEQTKIAWQDVINGKIQASAAMKQAFAAMQNAVNAARLTTAQIGQIALNMSQSRQMFPLLMENQRGQNWSQVQERIFKGVQISEQQMKNFEQEINNRLRYIGAGTDTWLYRFAAPWVLPMITKPQDQQYFKNH